MWRHCKFSRKVQTFFVVLACSLACTPLGTVSAQPGAPATVVVQQGGPNPGMPQPGQVPPGQAPGQPPPNGAPTEGTPGAPPNAAGGASPGAAAPGGPVKRQEKPPEPPNKKEFEVRPDENGMVEFQFRNQSWPDVLNWIAATSNLSLDWQELPSDYLNIATQRKQTLEDTRDMINRHLLARGYTMLELDGVIQVAKTAGINVSLVPKVSPEVLNSLPPNRFVRTSFALKSLIAKDVATEFKPLISSNGMLNALEATNRLEAMDSAANLSELNRIIQEEESDDATDGLAREFVFEFVRAVEAREQMMSFLGIESKSARKGPVSPEEMMMQQQQMQMQMQMQQQRMAQQGAQPAGNRNEEVYLVANIRRNSVIAHAPPNKMAILATFVKRIDVPSESSMSLQRLETRMKVYRLSSLDPKQLVASMIAMDALEPTSRLEVDEKNRAIIAYASLSDQLIIQQTIDRLDGSARDFEVIQLRRLKAEDVAGTIKFLMGKEEPKEDNRNRNRFFYDPFSFNQNQEKPSNDLFRVGANTQDNQLLLWANEIEIKEVTKLLVKLGELPPEGTSRSNVRMVDASRSKDTKEYLERLKEAWSKVSTAPLILPGDDEFISEDGPVQNPNDVTTPPGTRTDTDTPRSTEKKNPSSTDSKKEEKESQGDQEKKSKESNVSETSKESSETITTELASSIADVPPIPGRLSAVETKDTKDEVSNSDTKSEGALQIKFDEKGNFVLSGNDLDALDRLEKMMISNAPPQRRYEVFYIQHTRPSWIELNLKDYFKEEDDPKKDNNGFMSWYFGFDVQQSDKKKDPQLGRSRKLKFISDMDTRSLIVIGADEQQLKSIKSLIKLWDVPEKTNRQKLRFTKLVQVEHSKAESIVEAIKDAYRDLLSTNDKAFNKGKEEGGKESKHEDSTESVSNSGGMNYSFTGRLSMGIDRITNSIIVSAEGEDLLKLVVEMIKELDNAAQPSGAVQMIQLGGTNSDAMERALKALIGRKDDRPNMQGLQGNPNGSNQGNPGQPQGNAPGQPAQSNFNNNSPR